MMMASLVTNSIRSAVNSLERSEYIRRYDGIMLKKQLKTMEFTVLCASKLGNDVQQLRFDVGKVSTPSAAPGSQWHRQRAIGVGNFYSDTLPTTTTTNTTMEKEESNNRTVCITGAGGFVASWLVKLLLSRRYVVMGTVRDPEDPKHIHLKKLDEQNHLQLVKADLLDYNSLSAAFTRCHGVFHVASPVPSSSVSNPEVDLVMPAVNGTLNVLKACSAANVKRVVMVSSAAAVMMNPNWPQSQAKDESCWSDPEYCKTTNNWYGLSKTVAEREAWEYAKGSDLDVVTLCPSLILGPMLQQAANASSLILLKLMKETNEEIRNMGRNVVDVRDVCEALILVYEKAEAEGRYICNSHPSSSREFVEIMRKHYPNYKYPKRFIEANDLEKLSSEKLERLGWKYRPLEETVVDSVESYKRWGLLVD